VTGPRRLDTGIESSTALLLPPPSYWSYSSLREAEACPRRYALSRARYPDLWDGTGYPRVPRVPALFGDVVHDALDTIVSTLTAAGCESARSAEAAAALRALGGYTAIIEAAVKERLAGLTGNPRVSEDLRRRIDRDLSAQVADARYRVQTYITALALGPGRKTAAAPDGAVPGAPGTSTAGKRAPLGTGAHAEVTLRSAHPRLTGRVDLLRVSEADADITDYKTGTESPSHQDQLELYALLWDLDRDANPDRLPVARLTAAYPGRDVTFPVPGQAGLRAIEVKISASISTADAEIAADVPRAIPSPANCGSCDVRHLCGDYWATAAPDPTVLADGARLDCQGLVGAANGPRSWWLHLDGPGQRELLLQSSPAGPELHPGRRIRILGLRMDADPESGSVAASAGAATEVFTMTASSAAG
jgi:hypothetical protein